MLDSFKTLIKMYSDHANEDGTNKTISMGGFQQFLNKKLTRSNQNQDSLTDIQQLRKGCETDQATVFDLPDSLQLHVFSYLGARDLCVLSRVCRKWYDVSWDEILWKKKIEYDAHTWNVIGHTTNPDLYSECQSDLSYKQVYLQCCPEVQRILLHQNTGFHHLSSILRSFWPRKRTPRIAMFGPGLETSTSKITRNILEDRTGKFKTTGMFPGQFEGVGSGFTLNMSDVMFNLITLYTSTRKERENVAHNQRMRHNRLLNHVQPDGAAAPNPEAAAGAVAERFEVQQAVRDLCRTLDAYIFVIDVSSDELVESARPELMAMVQELWPCPGVPVLVLACTSDGSSNISCLTVARHLRLNELNRPWQVYRCGVENMTGVCEGIEWVVQQAQRT